MTLLQKYFTFIGQEAKTLSLLRKNNESCSLQPLVLFNIYAPPKHVWIIKQNTIERVNVK